MPDVEHERTVTGLCAAVHPFPTTPLAPRIRSFSHTTPHRALSHIINAETPANTTHDPMDINQPQHAVQLPTNAASVIVAPELEPVPQPGCCGLPASAPCAVKGVRVGGHAWHFVGHVLHHRRPAPKFDLFLAGGRPLSTVV